MQHQMKLKDKYFQAMKKGNKTIEMRLFDEKRKLIKVGDEIEFENTETKEKLMVKVHALHHFKNFEGIYSKFNKINLGYEIEEIAKPEDMSQFYDQKEIEKFGVVGIEVKMI